VSIKAIEIEFKYVLQEVEACKGVMTTLSKLNAIKHTFNNIHWKITVRGLEVYSTGYDLETKVLLIISDDC
jgi:hypothetical protein